MHPLYDLIDQLGIVHPATFTVLFLLASWLMIWRLEAMLQQGLDGTALGTLIVPYCSGLGNLVFVFLLWRDQGAPVEIMVNSLVNNTTNLTLLLGLPALIWPLHIVANKGGKSQRRTQQLSRLALLLTLAAVLFFTGLTWALGRDGQLDRGDGLALIGVFLFWQCFQVFDVLKDNVRRGGSFGWRFYIDLVLIALSGWVIYESLDGLVAYLSAADSGFFSAANLGWITGWLLVLPNALLAFYYAWRRRADIVYSSQVGDGHICIPLCLGLFAVLQPVPLPDFFQTAVIILGGAVLVHGICLLTVGRLPRPIAAGLVVAYAWFVYTGLIA
ncbi:sodium:calcium symporter [Actomonas aquatica]|uniref:Sodium:calcium symporter n=1 Tax=Actomonas aquatica TaxID=2866162 RepID=A0ABZ1C354_9BACT|nr:sodium:calcium symporter [Opitutus sp. WL0086]WRQ86143.1 sodium:calcium symporter [Opitutus sp. WL0086]